MHEAGPAQGTSPAALSSILKDLHLQLLEGTTTSTPTEEGTEEMQPETMSDVQSRRQRKQAIGDSHQEKKRVFFVFSIEYV